MSIYSFDDQQRFVINDFAQQRPFASFLPGIAGPLGVPLWVFYVNRGQGIASFGVGNKDNPIMEFQPANKAYQLTPSLGFRTFLRVNGRFAEPFSPFDPSSAERQMIIEPNALGLRENNATTGLATEITYFTLTNEPFAGLVRQVSLRNLTDQSLDLELLDGMPAVMPYGVDNGALKYVSRTAEAWMEVFNVANAIPFYRYRATAADTAEVETLEAGHFYFTAVSSGDEMALLPAIVDPLLVFGQNSSLSRPDRFLTHGWPRLGEQSQITMGKTPCGFFGHQTTLAGGATLRLYALIGHAADLATVNREQSRLLTPAYFARQQNGARDLARSLTDVIQTETAVPLFDAYTRQTFMDNLLRGGWPIQLGGQHIYHLYSRKHGDLERDYNDFYLAPEPYSQGNGNYRDVNQNRRCDLLFAPYVGDFNIRTFMNLIQADGLNPLVVNGSQFRLPPHRLPDLLPLAGGVAPVAAVLQRPFTPGQLLATINNHQIELRVPVEEFLHQVMAAAEQEVVATFGEGYWIDHWTYNLDLIENYLAIYPDRKKGLLFGDAAGNDTYTFYDSPAFVRPRRDKYVLANDEPRQFNAVYEDEAKEALLASRSTQPHAVRLEDGQGEIYQTTLITKLIVLAINKFATLDPSGIGVEMESNKPGWYDALNGLPGLFGSSLPETVELERLLAFLLAAMGEYPDATIVLPAEVGELLQTIEAQLRLHADSSSDNKDFIYWDGVATARETYREQVRFGWHGEFYTLSSRVLGSRLTRLQQKVRAGIQKGLALTDGAFPTYLFHTPTEYTIQKTAAGEPRRDKNGRPYITVHAFAARPLPLFLEGPVRLMKRLQTAAWLPGLTAADLHRQVRQSDLFDEKLSMYKVNSSLADEPHDIGRARAFTPGWLENESIWLHMAYKYSLALLDAGLYAEFFADMAQVMPPFMDPAIYGRSPLENSSFIVSSAHPDTSIHGRGFVARLSGSTAEFLSIWHHLFIGKRPFRWENDQLALVLQPNLPAWLFKEDGTVTTTFLGQTAVTYHNPTRQDTFGATAPAIKKITLEAADGETTTLNQAIIPAPYALAVRQGEIKRIHIYFE